MKFGKLLKAARIDSKTTLRKLASLVGPGSAGNLSRVERGIVLPSYRAVPWWCELYAVSLDDGIKAYLQDLAEKIRQIP